jgi:hypothetical protein
MREGGGPSAAIERSKGSFAGAEVSERNAPAAGAGADWVRGSGSTGGVASAEKAEERKIDAVRRNDDGESAKR